MADIELTDLCGYLDKIHWGYHTLEAEQLILTGFPCPVPFYSYAVPIEIRLTPHWITIRAFLQRRVSQRERSAVLALLSKLNAQCRLARFFLVEDCVVAQIDVTRATCRIFVFLEALKVVCTYASSYGVEVAVLATSPTLAEFFDRLEERALHTETNLTIQEDDPRLSFDISANRIPADPQ
jgi:hypothetical protein